MNGFRDGVKYYTTGTVEIYFPEGKTVCRECTLLTVKFRRSWIMKKVGNIWKIRKNGEDGKRYICQFTKETIHEPDYTRGQFCPVKLEEPVF